MELGPLHARRRGRPRWGLLAACVLLPVIAISVLPPVFGLRAYVAGAHGPLAPGSIAVVRSVPTTDLRPGDVVTVSSSRVAGRTAPGRDVVAARVESVSGATVEVRSTGSGEATVRLVAATTPVAERVGFAVPYVGAPLLLLDEHTAWLTVLAAGVVLLVALLRRPSPAVSGPRPRASAYASEP